MRGSAIPRRWVISLALVGLVSLFAVTLTTSWTDPSRASAQTGTIPSNILGSVQLAPNNVNIAVGGSLQLEARPRNQNGEFSPNMPGLTYTWERVSGPGVNPTPQTNQRFATFEASGAGTAVLKVIVEQGTSTGMETEEAVVTVNIFTPGPTPTPAPAPTNPGPVPDSIPNADAVITPAAGGTLESSDDPKIEINVPSGATTEFLGVTIETVTEDVPPGPNSFRIGSIVVEITFYDDEGNALEGFRLDRAAEICLPVSQDDLFAAAGGVGGLTILRYADPPGQWVELNTTYNAITGQVCARSSNFSLFAVGLSTDFGAPSGSELPATGDTPLSAGILAFLGVTGVAFVGVGAVALRRSRKAGSAG